jgi:hypothetical protein
VEANGSAAPDALAPATNSVGKISGEHTRPRASSRVVAGVSPATRLDTFPNEDLKLNRSLRPQWALPRQAVELNFSSPAQVI